ncbi:DUF4252 domain-containing protein [Prevotella sp. HUN102]|uniref:DUF4252 domain-containing protein n=1 Tax=Prevotella sp. HUN102 TaxID=1392486 RepID=UPI00048B7143|nr:DUF4252 domain-containing protein [Prevotella sp. HUN102]
MKKILFIFLLSLICGQTFAQKAIFDKYEDVKGVSTVYISKNMFQMMGGKVGDKDLSKIAKKLEHMQILECERPSMIQGIKNFATTVLNQQRYEVAMKVNDGDERVTIYQKNRGNGKNEFVLLAVEKDEISIINILGNVSLQDIKGFAGD